jgi:hypothetical protein
MRRGKLLQSFRTKTALSILSGLFQDDPNNPKKHSQLWEDFNICWLSLCQKQKDLTEAILGAGQALPTSLLSAEAMENMGQAIIRFCDTVEPHGLVDYQMGIWEEEILDGTYTLEPRKKKKKTF